MAIKNFIIIAHRGESYDAPENTLASVNLAWERRADAVEIDIRMTKDKKIVVIHDSSTKRTGDQNYKINECLYNELKNVNVGFINGNKYNKETIPLLTDVIKTIPEDKLLLIDIKTGKEIIPYLENVISSHKHKTKNIIFISEIYETLKKLKQRNPEVETYLILEKKWYRFGLNAKQVIKKCRTIRLDGIDIKDGIYLTKEFIDTIKNAGLKIYTWTVNDPARAQILFNNGINGITTDRALWLKGKLN